MKGHLRPKASFEAVVDREVPETVRPERPGYAIYTLSVEAELSPAGGDGWNEPRWEAYACVYPSVDSVRVEFGGEGADRDGMGEPTRVVEYTGDFIGPVEPGVVAPGDEMPLTEAELRSLEGEAFETAWSEPDPDRAYESKGDR